MRKPPRNPLSWVVAGALTGVLGSIVMGIFISIILFAPKPYPGIKEVIKQDMSREDGTIQTKYWVGLLKEEWTFKNGFPQGYAYQFYPNGSTLRRLHYVDGRLEGAVEEYYEKPGSARGVSRRYVAKKPPQLKLGSGKKKAVWNFRDGTLDGTYALHFEDETIREEGSYLEGKRHGFFRKYSRKGKLKSEVFYENGKKVRGGRLVTDIVR